MLRRGPSDSSTRNGQLVKLIVSFSFPFIFIPVYCSQEKKHTPDIRQLKAENLIALVIVAQQLSDLFCAEQSP